MGCGVAIPSCVHHARVTQTPYGALIKGRLPMLESLFGAALFVILGIAMTAMTAFDRAA